MYRPFITIRSTARTWKGINRAIARNTDITDYLEDEESLARCIKEGWITFTATTFTVWEEYMC